MPHYTYLIIGGGMTAEAAVQGIREVDADRSIGIVGVESDPPYKRPPLSKGLWKGEPIESIWRKSNPTNAIDWYLGRRIHTLDVGRKQAIDDQETTYTFDKCLLATGCTPRRLPFGGDQINYFRTLADYRRLRTQVEQGDHFAVIGGGFIGSEIAAALAMNQKTVTLIVSGADIGSRVYPPGLARFVSTYYREHGVEVLTQSSAISLESQKGKLVLKLKTADPGEEQEVVVDGVVAGIGVEPNVALAREAGLVADNGIVVNEQLQTNHPDIYAAGDVASFSNPALGQRIRVEHEDNAKAMGRAAGRSMAGQVEPYHYLPFFYSDLFDLGYEAVGQLDSRMQLVEDWQKPNHKGSIYYLKGGRVRGVLLWNFWDQVGAARELIAAPGPFQSSDLKGYLPRP